MKKLIAFVIVALGFLSLAAFDEWGDASDIEFPMSWSVGVAPSNTVVIVSVDKEGRVVTKAEPVYRHIYYPTKDYPVMETITTNLVIKKEVERVWYEPCACPDGNAGCTVLHLRKMSEVRHVPLQIDDLKPENYTGYVIKSANP